MDCSPSMNILYDVLMMIRSSIESAIAPEPNLLSQPSGENCEQKIVDLFLHLLSIISSNVACSSSFVFVNKNSSSINRLYF